MFLKYFSTMGLYKEAETADLIIENKGGCQKGLSTIDMAITKVIM